MTDDELEQWRARQEAKSQRDRYFTGLEQTAARSQIGVKATVTKAANKPPAPKTQMRPTHTRVRERTQFNRTRQTNCLGCGTALRPKNSSDDEFPNTVRNFAGGRCMKCYVEVAVASAIDCRVCGRKLRPPQVRARQAPGTVLPGKPGICVRDLRAEAGGVTRPLRK